jgi:hypothetical protein
MEYENSRYSAVVLPDSTVASTAEHKSRTREEGRLLWLSCGPSPGAHVPVATVLQSDPPRITALMTMFSTSDLLGRAGVLHGHRIWFAICMFSRYSAGRNLVETPLVLDCTLRFLLDDSVGATRRGIPRSYALLEARPSRGQ